jgi:hypothetical protein
MATRTSLLAILNGLHQMVDLTADELVLDTVMLGGNAGTVLSKTILDNLIALQDGTDFSDGTGSHTHDGRYFTETELGDDTGAGGSTLLGDDNSYSNFTPAASTIKGALSGIDTALGSVSADAKDVKVSANDSTPGFLEGKIVSANSMLTIATLNDAGDEDLQLTIVNSAIDHGTLAGLADDDHTQYHNNTRGDARYYQKSEFVTTSTAGAPVKLDGGGKISSTQLPAAVMTYEGTFDASATPATPLLNGDGAADAGMVYLASVAGSYNFGAGAITFAIGDWAVYNGTIWEKSVNSNAVVSVNGSTGVVTVNAINQLTGDVTATVASGSQSKATTVAAIAGTTVSGTTGTGNVMFSASPTTTGTLTAAAISASGTVTGSNLSGTNTGDQTITLTGDVTGSGTGSFSTTIANNAVTASKIAAAAFDGTTITGGGGSAAAVQYAPMVKKTMVAGESMAANTSFLVRMAVTGETAGRVYKATNAAAATDGKFYALGIALKTSAVSAGDSVDVVFMGSYTQGSSDTAFASGDVGKPVYLTTAGAMSVTAPSSSGAAVYRIGVVETTTKIWIDSKQLNGILA